MKHICLFLIIILVISNTCMSQQTFETLIRNSKDQVIHDVLEDSGGNFLLIGVVFQKIKTSTQASS